MDSFSSRTFHAIEAVLYIACHSGTEPVRGRDISAYQGVAVRYLEPMLQRLVHAGILRGVRGPKGGYLLARERRKIQISEIVDLMRAGSEEAGQGEVSPLRKAVTGPLWDTARREVMTHLGTTTIQDLCQKAAEKHVRIGKLSKDDFTI